MVRTIEDAIKNTCWSTYEGCACKLKLNHDGLHICASPDCDENWTTQQSQDWEAEMRKKYRTDG